MLHHQDGAASRHLLDELRDTVHVFVAHALGGFVQQHQLGLHGQGGGNLQSALAAIGQVDGGFVGQVGQAHFGQQRKGAVVELAQRGLTLPEVVGRAQAALQADAHVLQQGQVGENGGDLERPDHTTAGDLCRTFAGDVHPVEDDLARGGFEKFGEQVEAGGLACPVGPDQGMDGTTAHGQIDLADRSEALEFLGEILCLEDCLAHCFDATLFAG